MRIAFRILSRMVHTIFVSSFFICIISAIPLSKVAKDCCGSSSSCCLSRLMADTSLEECGEEQSQWRNMTACIESILWNEPISSYELDECCQFLYPSECSSSCLRYMRTPTRSAISKLSFTVHCPSFDRIPLDDDCIASIKHKLHECFGVCITRKAARLNYRPHSHCPAIIDPELLDPCIGDEI